MEPSGEPSRKIAKCHKCETCGKYFTVPAMLKRHSRTHTGEKPYKCDICMKTFSLKGNLNTHLRIHSYQRPYQCEVCKKAFIQQGHLATHKNGHKTEKPYACEVCTTAFTCQRQLTVHTARMHGEKPYACDICGKRFRYNYDLKRHRQCTTHYMCIICNEMFTGKKAKKHMKIHSSPNVTDLMQNIVSAEKVELHKIQSTSSLGGENKYKSDSNCETVQQVRTQARPSRSNTNEYETDEKTESSLSPASLLLHASAVSPSPSQPQYDTHEQKSGISQDLLDAVEEEYSRMTPPSRTTVIQFTGRSMMKK